MLHLRPIALGFMALMLAACASPTATPTPPFPGAQPLEGWTLVEGDTQAAGWATPALTALGEALGVSAS